MKKLFLFLPVVLLANFIPSISQARCGYYAGIGYHCYGDQGGTGGEVFKQMDENTKNCGYFDPGCQKVKKPTERTSNRKAPKRSGYERPRSR